MKSPCFAVVSGGKMVAFSSLEENAQHAARNGKGSVVSCWIIPRDESFDPNNFPCYEVTVRFIVSAAEEKVEKSLSKIFIADCKKDAVFYGMLWAKNRSESLTTGGEKWELSRVDISDYTIVKPDGKGYIASKSGSFGLFQWRADRDKPFGEAMLQKLAEANNPLHNPAPEPGPTTVLSEWSTEKPKVSGLYWILTPALNAPYLAKIAVTESGEVYGHYLQGEDSIPNNVSHWMTINTPRMPEPKPIEEEL